MGGKLAQAKIAQDEVQLAHGGQARCPDVASCLAPELYGATSPPVLLLAVCEEARRQLRRYGRTSALMRVQSCCCCCPGCSRVQRRKVAFYLLSESLRTGAETRQDQARQNCTDAEIEQHRTLWFADWKILLAAAASVQICRPCTRPAAFREHKKARRTSLTQVVSAK